MKVVRNMSQDTQIKGWRLVEEEWVATYNSQKWSMNKRAEPEMYQNTENEGQHGLMMQN